MKTEYYVIAAIFSILVSALGFMLKSWKDNWETRLTAQDSRLDKSDDRHGEHDVNHATIKTHLEHIKETADQTSEDVKTLLRHSNGNRSTG